MPSIHRICLPTYPEFTLHCTAFTLLHFCWSSSFDQTWRWRTRDTWQSYFTHSISFFLFSPLFVPTAVQVFSSGILNYAKIWPVKSVAPNSVQSVWRRSTLYNVKRHTALQCNSTEQTNMRIKALMPPSKYIPCQSKVNGKYWQKKICRSLIDTDSV